MYPRVITIEAIYDNSDMMTDYFAPDTPIERWYVCDVQGKVINEAKLRTALRLLPEWFQKLSWIYRKGEKYSMSDHPYGQLRAKGIGIMWPKTLTYGRFDQEVEILMDSTSLDTFKMNDSIENPTPATYEAFKAFIEQQITEREARLRRPIINQL